MNFPASSPRDPPLDGDDDRSARAAQVVFRILADGEPHRLVDLAVAVSAALLPTMSPEPSRDPAAAVHTAIGALRHAGMRIDVDGDAAIGRSTRCLDAGAIAEWLVAAGTPDWDVRVAWSSDSTNTALLAAIRAGTVRAPALRTCEIQHGGRGRLGRRWSSAPGASLTMSVALCVARPLSGIDGATLVCGLAVRDALADVGVEASLKWPNDVLVDGRKVAGILVEAHAAGARTTLVVGVGVNVLGRSGDDAGAPRAGTTATGKTSTAETPTIIAPTDLERCEATNLDRNRLAGEIAAALARELVAFEATGFAPFAQRWNRADAFAGRAVVVGSAHDAGDRVAGIARGVDRTGALQLDVDGVRQRIIAGDVSLRPVASAGVAA